MRDEEVDHDAVVLLALVGRRRTAGVGVGRVRAERRGARRVDVDRVDERPGRARGSAELSPRGAATTVTLR